jgi:hypothetical protein
MRQLPLSAGGSLSVYGSIIDQGGVLRAPLGSITLGWDGTGTAAVNALSGANQAVSQQITLRAGSITSVSAVDPATGQPLVIPCGLNLNDVSGSIRAAPISPSTARRKRRSASRA